MLKKKFRELEKTSGIRPRSTSSYTERNSDLKVNVKDYRLPAKPATNSAYNEERGMEGGRYRTLDSDHSKTRHEPSWHSSASFSTHTFPGPRGPRRLSLVSADRPLLLASDKDPLPPQSYSKVTQDPIKVVSFPPSARDLVSKRDYGDSRVKETLSVSPRSSTFSASGETLGGGPKAMLDKSNLVPTMIEIPHAGEVIKFSLEKQLEPNPVGIIRMLSTVKADQKVCP